MSGEQTCSSAPLPGASPVLTRISHTLRSTKRMIDKASMWWGSKFTQGDGCLLQGGSQLATSEAIARIAFAVPRCVSKAMAGKVDFAKNFVCAINKDRFHRNAVPHQRPDGGVSKPPESRESRHGPLRHQPQNSRRRRRQRHRPSARPRATRAETAHSRPVGHATSPIPCYVFGHFFWFASLFDFPFLACLSV